VEKAKEATRDSDGKQTELGNEVLATRIYHEGKQ
jgi:hypothetical protein